MKKVGKACLFIVGFFCLAYVVGSFSRRETSDQVLAEQRVTAKSVDRVGRAELLNEGHYQREGVESAVRPENKTFRRNGSFSLKVKNAIETQEGIEKSLDEQKGELIDLVMEGAKEGRHGLLTAQVPVENFNAFIRFVRGCGEVLTERVTVRKIAASDVAAEGGVNYRELAAVSISFAEDVAMQVREGKGVLATSLNNGYANILKGTAVLIEGISYVLPFVFALAILGILVWRIIRKRSAVKTAVVQQ